MKKLNKLLISECRNFFNSTSDIHFFFKELDDHVEIYNSFIFGAIHVLINNSLQIDTAYKLFLNDNDEIIELIDPRFPKTYGETYNLELKGLYPFAYDKSELIIDLRTVTPRTATPQTVTPQTVTPRTATPQTVTPQTVTPQTVTPQTVTNLCKCGCGSILIGRQKYFLPACRKRAQRHRDKSND